jgi:hypothetical protein
MLIPRQNSYAPRSRRCTGRREAKSRELANKIKKKTLCTSFGMSAVSRKQTRCRWKDDLKAQFTMRRIFRNVQLF